MLSCNMRPRHPKSLLGVDYNGMLVWRCRPAAPTEYNHMNQGWVAEQSNSRGNERCLSSCGYCAPDQDRGINTVWTNPRSHTNQTLKSSKHRNIIQQRKDAKKITKLLRRIRVREAQEIGSKNRQRDRSREIKPLRPCQSINTVVQRSACNSGGFEHHLYGWGSGGSLVQSGWRVMAVRAGLQCRAAGWHSDEDNDVLVSHRITRQTHSHGAGVGRLGRGGPQMHPSGTNSPRGLAFSVPIVQWSSSTVQEGWNEAGSTHVSNVQKGSIHIVKGAVASIKPHGL